MDIELQRFDSPCFEPLDGDGTHHRIIGAKFQRRDVQFQPGRVHRLLQLLAKQAVGGDSSAHA